MPKKKLTPWQVAGHILHTTILSILAILMAAILVLANTLLPTYGRMLNEIIGYIWIWSIAKPITAALTKSKPRSKN